MAENTKYVARVPIVPDDFDNKNDHKNHELVMDFSKDDIYVKKDDGYVNITGQIKEEIKKIKDGTAVIHLVTEDSLPAIADRLENHWYLVITRSKEQAGSEVSTYNYIYYGLINNYDTTKNYLLIGQNVTSGVDTVPFDLIKNYCPCFYVPICYEASFTDHTTGQEIEFEKVDRLYALNSSAGTYVSYDVYVLNLTTESETAVRYYVDLALTGTNNFYVYFDANITSISGLVLPSTMTVRDGDCIGTISDPTWDDPRYIFDGWSTDKNAKVIIDPTSYKPESNMTLYAWFTYESDPTLLTYYSTYNSSGT